jgi:hypothetical protein
MAFDFLGVQRGSTYFTIVSTEDKTTFQATFGDGSATVTEGYGGWTVTARPRDVGITEWRGRNPMAIEIPFIIDFYLETESGHAGQDCENQISNLEKLCGLGGHAQPPVCVVDGGGAIPHDYTIAAGHRWVVESVNWDRALELRSAVSSRRTRAGGMIVIRQFIEAKSIFRRLGPNSRAAIPKSFMVTKQYDTLGKIATLMYDDASKWKIIADYNGKRDWRTLKIGETIKIPPI